MRVPEGVKRVARRFALEDMREAQERAKMPKKAWVVVAMLVFIATSLTGVLCNEFAATMGYNGLRLGTSISRYVGATAWTAILFALGNIIVVGVSGAFLFQLGWRWKMPKLFFLLVLIMAIMFLWLSFCPVGYFDTPEGVSLITRLHEISSRTMFATMMFVSAMIAGNRNATTFTRLIASLFSVYGIFCLWGFVSGAPWFYNLTLVFESSFILLFSVVMLCCFERRGSYD